MKLGYNAYIAKKVFKSVTLYFHVFSWKYIVLVCLDCYFSFLNVYLLLLLMLLLCYRFTSTVDLNIFYCKKTKGLDTSYKQHYIVRFLNVTSNLQMIQQYT